MSCMAALAERRGGAVRRERAWDSERSRMVCPAVESAAYVVRMATETGVIDTRAPLATFLALTFALSAVWYSLIIAAGSLGARGGLYVLALMWSPGTSALVTRLVFQRNVRGEGWRWGA